MDILPTILDALDMPADTLTFQGRSLLPLIHGKSVSAFKRRAVFIEGEFAGELVFQVGDFHVLPEMNLIFDLSKDPEEERSLNEFIFDLRLKSLARDLSRKYLETYTSLHDIIAPAGVKALDVNPETLRRLRALGYIQ